MAPWGAATRRNLPGCVVAALGQGAWGGQVVLLAQGLYCTAAQPGRWSLRVLWLLGYPGPMVGHVGPALQHTQLVQGGKGAAVGLEERAAHARGGTVWGC